MLQESTGWDPRAMHAEPSVGLKLYSLYLFVVCVVTVLKLLRIWWIAPPFMPFRGTDASAYVSSLRNSAGSLKQWLTCTLLVSGIFFSTTLYRFCDRILDSERVGFGVVAFVIRDFSTEASIALLIVLFAFLVRWHLLTRVRRWPV